VRPHAVPRASFCAPRAGRPTSPIICIARRIHDGRARGSPTTAELHLHNFRSTQFQAGEETGCRRHQQLLTQTVLHISVFRHEACSHTGSDAAFWAFSVLQADPFRKDPTSNEALSPSIAAILPRFSGNG
jgi:hypothetical protein